MRGTFNGVPIENVFAMNIDRHRKRTVLRVLDSPSPELEQQFALKSRAAVNVSIYEFEGKVVRYDRAVPEGVYEVTIVVKNSQPTPRC